MVGCNRQAERISGSHVEIEFAANLEFEKAAALRDELVNLRKQIGGNESLLFQGKAPKIFQHALKELIGT